MNGVPAMMYKDIPYINQKNWSSYVDFKRIGRMQIWSAPLPIPESISPIVIVSPGELYDHEAKKLIRSGKLLAQAHAAYLLRYWGLTIHNSLTTALINCVYEETRKGFEDDQIF